MMRALTAFLFVFLVFSAVARAETPDDAGAQELKSVLEEVFDSYADSVLAGQTLAYEGEITVAPGAGLYSAVIPGVTVHSLTGFRIDIGDVRVNARRGGAAGEDGAWLLSAALPERFSLIDAAQERAAEVTVGRQYFAGAWVPALGTFTRLDASYEDVVVKTGTNEVLDLSVGSMKYIVNLAQDGDGTWSGPRGMEIRDVSFTNRDDKGFASYNGTLEKVATRVHFKAFSLLDAKKARDQVRAQREAEGENLTTETAIESVRQQMLALPGAYALALEARGLDINYVPDSHEEAGGTPRTPMHAAFDRATLDVDMKGLRADRGGVKLRFKLDDMDTSGIAVPLDGLVPQQALIDLRLGNLPMQNLVRIASAIMDEMIEGVSKDDRRTQQKVSDLIVAIPESLSSAGAEFTAWDSFVQTKDLKLMLEGRLTADMASPIVAVGRINLKVEGLDELIKKYREMDPNNIPAQQYVQGLIPAQLAGQLTNPQDGRASIRTYDVAFTPDGDVTLNGADIAALKVLLQQQKRRQDGMKKQEEVMEQQRKRKEDAAAPAAE